MELRNNCLASITDGQIQCTRSSLSTDKIYILLYKYNVVSEKTRKGNTGTIYKDTSNEYITADKLY